MMPVHNNIWYKGKVHGEGTKDTSVTLCLLCNGTPMYYDHTRIWSNTGIIDMILALYVNKPRDNTDTDACICSEMELKSPKHNTNGKGLARGRTGFSSFLC